MSYDTVKELMSHGKELITTQLSDGLPSEYVNDLTKEMDKHLHSSIKKFVRHGYGKTYLYRPNDRPDGIAIRFPGATRGHINLDANRCITGVVLYKDIPPIYKKSVQEAFDKYKGYKIVVPEVDK